MFYGVHREPQVPQRALRTFSGSFKNHKGFHIPCIRDKRRTLLAPFFSKSACARILCSKQIYFCFRFAVVAFALIRRYCQWPWYHDVYVLHAKRKRWPWSKLVCYCKLINTQLFYFHNDAYIEVVINVPVTCP